jgi:hypothetical protein
MFLDIHLPYNKPEDSNNGSKQQLINVNFHPFIKANIKAVINIEIVETSIGIFYFNPNSTSFI